MPRRTADVIAVLVGVLGLLLKGQYSGPATDVVHSYGGNVAASFAVYFLARRVTARSRQPRVLALAVAIAIVQSVEGLDGFGVMNNVYDSLDLVANAVGVTLGVAVDLVMEKLGLGTPKRVAR
jgi:threonine/homoserine efflux transporter RhtA